ncbi:MAG: TIR domain-containing protein [Desulfovibrio sp.]|nr:TIR domain-containing protein [Desulfovibrio sp.]
MSFPLHGQPDDGFFHGVEEAFLMALGMVVPGNGTAFAQPQVAGPAEQARPQSPRQDGVAVQEQTGSGMQPAMATSDPSGQILRQNEAMASTFHHAGGIPDQPAPLHSRAYTGASGGAACFQGAQQSFAQLGPGFPMHQMPQEVPEVDLNRPYIFVSYKHKDCGCIIDFINEIRRRGYNCFYDKYIQKGAQWRQYIEKTLCESNIFIVFYSDTIKSEINDEVHKEITLAINNIKNSNSIICIKLDSIPILYGHKILETTQGFDPSNPNDKGFYTKEYLAYLEKKRKAGQAVAERPSKAFTAKLYDKLQEVLPPETRIGACGYSQAPLPAHPPRFRLAPWLAVTGVLACLTAGAFGAVRFFPDKVPASLRDWLPSQPALQAPTAGMQGTLGSSAGEAFSKDAGTLSTAPEPAEAGQRNVRPLLMDGKRFLYQRVVSHPDAFLFDTPSKSGRRLSDQALKPFTPLYVFKRKNSWLQVGTDMNRPVGWIQEGKATRWDQSLTLLFADRATRRPIVFFKSFEVLERLCNAPDRDPEIERIERLAAAGKQDVRVAAIEPLDSAVSRNKFYLMPILETQAPFDERLKLLKVASINPGSSKAGAGGTSPEAMPKTGIALVFDASLAMKPYIGEAARVAKALGESHGQGDALSFATVSYSGSDEGVSAKGECGFASSDDMERLERALAGIGGDNPPVGFGNGALAGVYKAIKHLEWKGLDNRIILLVSGAAPQAQSKASGGMGPDELCAFARRKGIRIIVMHVKTPVAGQDSSGKGKGKDEDAFKRLSRESDGRINYISVEAPDPETGVASFGALAVDYAGSLLEATTASRKGTDAASRLGYSIRLEYLGKKRGTEAPSVVNSWITDKDFCSLSSTSFIPAVEPAVLLTKNQLSDLHRCLVDLIDKALRTRQTDSDSFFSGIQSAAGRFARDPSVPADGDMALPDAIAEMLEGLPYRSDVMAMAADDWHHMSTGQQEAFLRRLQSKIKLYEEYDRDEANWVRFGTESPGDAVYRVPLSSLP